MSTLTLTQVDVTVLKLEPGDLLAILVDRELTVDHAMSIGGVVKKACPPGVSVLVFDVGMKPVVIRASTATSVLGAIDDAVNVRNQLRDLILATAFPKEPL